MRHWTFFGCKVTINFQFSSSTLTRDLRAVINALYRSMSWAYLHKILAVMFRIIETFKYSRAFMYSIQIRMCNVKFNAEPVVWTLISQWAENVGKNNAHKRLDVAVISRGRPSKTKQRFSNHQTNRFGYCPPRLIDPSAYNITMAYDLVPYDPWYLRCCSNEISSLRLTCFHGAVLIDFE